jgi:hypothetical protein
LELFDSLKLVTKPLFREMLYSGQLNSVTGQTVTCIIADGILSFPIDVGNELGIPTQQVLVLNCLDRTVGVSEKLAIVS